MGEQDIAVDLGLGREARFDRLPGGEPVSKGLAVSLADRGDGTEQLASFRGTTRARKAATVISGEGTMATRAAGVAEAAGAGSAALAADITSAPPSNARAMIRNIRLCLVP
ncbi:MAG: hypothetical protein EAY70_13460 [Sphingomonadales bacterium]|nr:MAG: hypothetical protein EAY70_13460 [Sphingomonadales bacterium]